MSSSSSRPHFLNTNSRDLPPLVRTHCTTPNHNSDSQRVGRLLNQDWNNRVGQPSRSPSSDRFRLSSRAVFPGIYDSRSRASLSDESHSSDDSFYDMDQEESDSYYSAREDRSSPSLTVRTVSPPQADIYRSPSDGSLSPFDRSLRLSLDNRRRNSAPLSSPPRRAVRHPSRDHAIGNDSLPSIAALHTSSRNSPTLPPITTFNASFLFPLEQHNDPSRRDSNSFSYPLPTPSPPPVTTPESSTSSIPYVNSHTPGVDEYIQKNGSSKPTCIWPTESGGVCGFQSSGSLVKRHIRTVHLKIRPVTCPVCKQRFSTKFHLKTHTNIHTGLKPYSCPDCFKTFSNPSSKHHHRVRYHGYVQSWRHYGVKEKR